MKRFAVIAAGLAIAFALSMVALAADTHDGTWRVNVAKSKYAPGSAPQSLTTKRTSQSDSIKSVFDGVDAQGNSLHYEYTAKMDGKDYPVTGLPSIDAISLKKIDADTYDWVTKKGGKEVARGRTVYSKDGKTRTQTQTERDAKGKAVKSTIVFERQ